MKLLRVIVAVLLVGGFVGPIFRRLYWHRPDLLYVPVPAWWDSDYA